MVNTWDDLRFDDRGGGRPRWWLSLLLGLSASLVIFLTLSRVRMAPVEKPAPARETLRAARLPDLPPPAPQSETAERSAPGTALHFPTLVRGSSMLSPSPSDSIVRIRATSPSMGPVVRPSIEPMLNFTPGLFQPRSELADADPNRVFSLREVDVPASPTHQVAPEISRRLFESVHDPRLTVLILVTATGAVENVWLLRSTGNEEFDALVVAAVRQWEFRPASRRHKAVRQWVQQPFVVRQPFASRFTN